MNTEENKAAYEALKEVHILSHTLHNSSGRHGYCPQCDIRYCATEKGCFSQKFIMISEAFDIELD